MNAGQEVAIDGVIKLATTAGTVSYSNGHGLMVSTAPLELSFIVPGGETKITLGRCQYSNEGTIEVSVDGDGTISPTSCANKTDTDNVATEFAYDGDNEATITFTFPNTSYIHYLAIENEAEPGTGESFTYWLDSAADEDGNIEKQDIDVAGGTVYIYDDFARYTAQGNYTDDDGVEHYSYRAAKQTTSENYRGNGSTTSLPTEGTAIGFVPTNNGEVTVYYTVAGSTSGSSTTYNFDVFSGENGSYARSREAISYDGETQKSYSFKVSNGTTYFVQYGSTNNLGFAGIEFVADELVKLNVTTDVNEDAAQFYTSSDVVSFTDVDSGEVYDTYKTTDTRVTLLKGHTYEVSISNAALNVSFADGNNTITIDDDISAIGIIISKAEAVALSGSITFDDETDTGAISGITSIKFENQIVSGLSYGAEIDYDNSTYTVEGIMPGEYNTVAETTNGYKTEDHVSVAADGTTVNEVYFYKDREVEPNGNSYITVGIDGNYETLTEAVEAIKAYDETYGRDYPITISILNDLEEQVILDVDNVKIEGNGHELTWYYALGALYYSADSSGYYSEVLYRDAYSRNPVATRSWGGVLIINGSDVTVEDLTIRNTFNYWVTDKEVGDGVIPDTGGEQKGSWTGQITEDSDVDNIIYKERACAVAPFGDHVEFYNCQILSSQDTLGINQDNIGCSVYYKDCVIGGNIDYICGGGTMLFDDCELQWYIMPGNTNGYGYITAAKKSPYIFRNCTITMSNEDYSSTDSNETKKSGYYGRPWDASAPVYFINTETNGTINANGWDDMSGAEPQYADFIEYCNTNNGALMAVSTYGNYNSDGTDKLSDQDVADKMEDYLHDDYIINTVLYGWEPSHYVRTIADNNIGTVFDINGNLIVYGFIDEDSLDNADEIGYMLSTLNNFIGKTKYMSDTVYGKVEYTDTNGEEQTIFEDGKYVFAYVIEDANTVDYTLYIRVIQTSDNDMIYGPKATATLTVTDISGSEYSDEDETVTADDEENTGAVDIANDDSSVSEDTEVAFEAE